jgi:hypothetical protein
LVRRLSRGVSISQAYSFAVTSVSRLLSLSLMATSPDLGVALEQVMMMSSRNKVNVQALLAACSRMPVNTRCLLLWAPGREDLGHVFSITQYVHHDGAQAGEEIKLFKRITMDCLVVADTSRFIRCSRARQLMSFSSMETVEHRKVPSLIEEELNNWGMRLRTHGSDPPPRIPSAMAH